MDTIEITRQTAERLHLAAAQKGANPWQPYAFACAEALRRSIAVEKLPMGDARLRGARASYDPGGLTILHEDAGNDFMNAFLVAHEIGHVEFGGAGESTLSYEVSPMRPAEAAPIGVDRVIDYGRRERREVQMDLFGRELLLPRSVVRKLHLDENLTATAIAQRLGAPFDVVAQQLLDALLLPPVRLDTDVHAEKSLNPEQRFAAEHWGSPYLLEAGPGTGKTQTLVGRVEWLLKHKKIPADQILVLTFSNKAAGELSDRLAARIPAAAAAMWIGTFHSFGLDIIRRFHERLKLPANPRLMDRTEAIDELADQFPRLDLKHYRDVWDPSLALSDILAAISRAKDEVTPPERYAELADAMWETAAPGETREAAEKCQEVAKVYAAYEALKIERQCLDFGDLVALPVGLIETDEEVRAQLRTRHRYVLVDEFQDVNRASVRLLKALCGDGTNLWVVGDAKQSIYRFRGASSVNIARFATKDFPGGQTGRLKVNYRSTEEIVSAFVAFAEHGMKAAASADVKLKAERGPSGVKPKYSAVDMAPDEVAAIAEAIETQRAAGISYRDQALLCTGNERLGRMAAELESMGIPLLFLGSLFERDEIQQLLSLLSLLIDRRAMGLARVGTIPEFRLSLAAAAAVIAHLREYEGEPLAWLTETAPLSSVPADATPALTRLRDVLNGFGRASPPWQVVSTILLDRTRFAAAIASSDDVAVRARGVAIWQFMNFVRAQPAAAGLPISRLLDRIRRLVLLADERDLRELPAAAQSIDALRVMTIHGSKGLEFRAVHLPGMNADTIPRSPNQMRGCIPPDGMIEGLSGTAVDILRKGHVEEQECLFFVAMSRARDRLLLYSPTKAKNGRRRDPSEFLARLGSTIVTGHVHPRQAVPPDADAAPVHLSFPSGIVLTDHQLALFQRCPRRFFYTHILEIGGRRTETPFMQMHNAVRSLVEWLTADPTLTPSAAELDARLTEAWDSRRLTDHGYSEDYRRIAKQLIGVFVSSRTGYGRAIPTEMRFRVGTSEVIVRPDEVLTAPNGQKHIRAIRTGHAGSKDFENISAGVFTLAAYEAFPGCTVEFVHLGDGTSRAVTMTDRVLNNRRSTAEEFVAEIRAGLLPRKESARTCPRCPAFFICGPLPDGVLEKNFSL